MDAEFILGVLLGLGGLVLGLLLVKMGYDGDKLLDQNKDLIKKNHKIRMEIYYGGN